MTDSDSNPRESGERDALPAMLAPADQAPESRMNERIRAARSALDLSIEALSRLSKEYDREGNGVSPASISRYESGDNLPGSRELRILCDSLDVPPLWLLYGRLDNPGENKIEQELLRVLSAYVHSKKDDFSVGDTTVSGMFKWEAKRVREERLSKARKPSTA
jgi:transcriptional regulator with XRE-family HTH domain